MNKIALVTGGGSGIGKALVDAGYAVVISGRRRDALDAAAKEIGATPVVADVGNPDSVAALFAEVKANHGRLDVLFNNAGMNLPAVPLEDITFDQWQTIIAANLTGVFLCTQAAIRLMKAQTPKGGRIINNGSISAHVPRPHSAPYTATKHAVAGMTKSTALDGRPHNIACGQIDIGNAATDMTEKMAAGVLQANGTTAVEPRMDVNEVGAAVVYMAGLPLSTNVLFMTVMASAMPFVGRG
jgi:NAD(P)-dependent dehydrogenase (short-subunit alcohol dehydrogenase family)